LKDMFLTFSFLTAAFYCWYQGFRDSISKCHLLVEIWTLVFVTA
jgi:hypothetical protein